MSREISESIYLFSYSNEPNYRQRRNFKLKDKNHATVGLYWFFKGTDIVLIRNVYPVEVIISYLNKVYFTFKNKFTIDLSKLRGDKLCVSMTINMLISLSLPII